MADGFRLFLKVLALHDDSDVTITCRRTRNASPDSGEVQYFFCHRVVLQQCCSIFAPPEPPSNKRRRTQLNLDASDEVVYEALRFVYCGTVHFSRFFTSSFFIQLFAVADFLGMKQMIQQRDSSDVCVTVHTLMSEPGMVHWLQDKQSEELFSLLQVINGHRYGYVRAFEDSRCASLPALSESMRQNLSAFIIRARPEFSVRHLAQLGDHFNWLVNLHPSLVNLRIVGLSGQIVAEMRVDMSATIADVAKDLMQRVGQPGVQISIVQGTEILRGPCSLSDIGAHGSGCLLTLGMIQQQAAGPAGLVCRCAQPVISLVVKKDGLNHGKTFYKCAGLLGEQCNFFQWAEP